MNKMNQTCKVTYAKLLSSDIATPSGAKSCASVVCCVSVLVGINLAGDRISCLKEIYSQTTLIRSSVDWRFCFELSVV